MTLLRRSLQALPLLLLLVAASSRASAQVTVTLGDATPNFGNVELGRTVSRFLIRITISAPGITGTTTRQVSGPAASDFTVTGPASIAPNQQVEYSVQFTPSQLGNRAASYTVKITLSNGNTVTVTSSASGVGVPPRIICPANITVINDPNQCGAVVTYPAPAAVGAAGAITCSPASGSFFPVGTTTVNCASASGATCSFTVTVNDTEPPTIFCDGDITVANDAGRCSAAVRFGAILFDNCLGELGVTAVSKIGNQVITSPHTFTVGTTTATWTATDASGNTATCSFTVTVNDSEPPTITCPPSVILPNDPGRRSATFTATLAAQDNCPGVTVTGTRSDGFPLTDTTYPVGATVITWTATDASGHQATCTQLVQVHDSQIVGVVGLDTNGNHLPDPPQEPRLKGVTIELRDPAADEFWAAHPETKQPEPLATTQTNDVGNFSFPVAPPGVYDVVVKLAPGQTISALFTGPTNQAQIVTVNGEPRLRVTMQAGDTVAGLGILLQ